MKSKVVTMSKPQGMLLITDIETGKTLFEGDLRQCIHCQNTWVYKPGSGALRGFCMNCNGHLCGRLECQDCYHNEKRIEDIEALARQNRASIEAAVHQVALRERLWNRLAQ